jgi:tight adherence protein B
MFLFLSFLIFTGALGAAAYYVWHVPREHAQELLASRLRELRVSGGARIRAATDLVRREQRGSLAFLGDFVSWIGVLRRLQIYIDQANLKYRAAEVFSLCLIIAVSIYVVLGFAGLSLLILRLGLALGLGVLPVVYISRVRNKRLHKFEEMLPDAIDLFNRSMKAGHNIHAGLETIAQETFDPVRMEFRKVVEELALGAPIDQTLHGLGNRVPIIDLKFFVTGLILQRQTGANMVQVLENLALLVRERLNLSEKMKSATAQQRLSAGLLCALPLVVAIGFWFLKPEYMRLLYSDEWGQIWLTYAIISEIVGILVIRKIANPKI